VVFAAKVSDVPEWGKKLVQVEGHDIILVKTKGVIYGCERECPHQGAMMDGAFIKEAGKISCPRHGYRFDLKTGICEQYPEYRMRVYPVEVRGEDIYVDLE
jgi:nitrite reductase/ring-hydroxylating ferredoxin subunit